MGSFRRRIAELIDISTKSHAAYQAERDTGGALSQRLRTASNSNYLILHAPLSTKCPISWGHLPCREKVQSTSEWKLNGTVNSLLHASEPPWTRPDSERVIQRRWQLSAGCAHLQLQQPHPQVLLP